MAIKKTIDPLLERKVRIHDDATSPRGSAHPHAGQEGLVVNRNPGGQYQIACATGIATLPMDSFSVLPADGSARPTAHPDDMAAGELLMLDMACIVASLTNPRSYFDPEALTSLAAVIKTLGFIQPILLRKLPGQRLQDTFASEESRHATHEIVTGERRFRAARMAGLRRIPVLVQDLTDPQVLELQLLENLQREDLRPLEEASGYERLMLDQGYTADMVAASMHKSRAHIFATVKLLTLCPEAKQALNDGSLSRSTALLVAQRPTHALQIEFTKRVLTGPNSEPMSYREAKELAVRHYMTKLSEAPFQLTDADLVPKAGSCTQCPNRTGANPELWDKTGPDTCTDTRCFADKKEAHYERLTLQAASRGQTIITGRQARELMPTENMAPAGYMLLDKPRNDLTQAEPSMRTVLGQDVPADKVVLIESPSGAMVEAISTRNAGAALQSKAAAKGSKAKPATKDELQAEYTTRWRTAAVQATIEALESVTDLDELPPPVAHRLILEAAQVENKDLVANIFNLRPGFTATELNTAAANVATQPLAVQLQALLMLATAYDLTPAHGRPVDEALELTATAAIAGVDLAAIKAKVQATMLDEAAERAGTLPPMVQPAKVKAPRTKTSKADAAASIAQALQQAEGAEPAAADPTAEDALYAEACEAVATSGKPSISYIQRTLNIGYNSAARLLARMESDGTVSSMNASGNRTMLQQATAPASSRRPVAYRYAATGETWTGRGKKPKWVEHYLAEGGTLENIKVDTEGAE